MENLEISDKLINDFRFEVLSQILTEEKDEIIESSKVELSEELSRDLLNILMFKLNSTQKKTYEIKLFTKIQQYKNKINEKVVTNKNTWLWSSLIFLIISSTGLYFILNSNLYLILKIILGIFSFLWFTMSLKSLIKFFKKS